MPSQMMLMPKGVWHSSPACQLLVLMTDMSSNEKFQMRHPHDPSPTLWE